jgi:hypothetical protein
MDSTCVEVSGDLSASGQCVDNTSSERRHAEVTIVVRLKLANGRCGSHFALNIKYRWREHALSWPFSTAFYAGSRIVWQRSAASTSKPTGSRSNLQDSSDHVVVKYSSARMTIVRQGARQLLISDHTIHSGACVDKVTQERRHDNNVTIVVTTECIHKSRSVLLSSCGMLSSAISLQS